MPISEAKKKANKKWNDNNLKEKYDRIQLVVPKGQKEEMQAAAQRAGISLNRYIQQAIEARMEHDNNAGGGSHISPQDAHTSTL